MANNYHPSHMSSSQDSNSNLRGGRQVCYHCFTVSPTCMHIHIHMYNIQSFSSSSVLVNIVLNLSHAPHTIQSKAHISTEPYQRLQTHLFDCVVLHTVTAQPDTTPVTNKTSVKAVGHNICSQTLCLILCIATMRLILHLWLTLFKMIKL